MRGPPEARALRRQPVIAPRACSPAPDLAKASWTAALRAALQRATPQPRRRSTATLTSRPSPAPGCDTRHHHLHRPTKRRTAPQSKTLPQLPAALPATTPANGSKLVQLRNTLKTRNLRRQRNVGKEMGCGAKTTVSIRPDTSVSCNNNPVAYSSAPIPLPASGLRLSCSGSSAFSVVSPLKTRTPGKRLQTPSSHIRQSARLRVSWRGGAWRPRS